MNDRDRIALSLGHGDDLAGQLWAFDEFGADEDRAAADLATGLTNVGFVRAALRRSARFWCATAVLGLLLGFAAFKSFPPAYQASTSVLLASNLPGPPGEAVQDDAAVAQSRAVAGDALRRLGLRESAASFTADYTATVVTSRILVITARATSSDVAVREANALAAAFLAFQALQLESQEQVVNASLQHQVIAAQQNIKSITDQIRQVSAQPGSLAQRARLGDLSTERSQAVSALDVFKQTVLGNEATAKIATETLVKGSQVLDSAVPLPQHAKKYLVLYVGGGLLAGLALGLLIVAVRALASDRLRRRDDVARALGAPVKLGVGRIQLSRWRPGRRGLESARGTDVRRIVALLEREVSPSLGSLASLAIVPVDDVQVPAVCLVSLAISCAQRGSRVVVADLCSGSPAARLLGVSDPGLHDVRMHDAHLVAVVPDPDDVVRMGPLGRRPRQAGDADDPLADACAAADLLLTLATLDPALGADYLPGWASGAVVVVTAGQSPEARVHAVGEMIRLAGMDLRSAVLVRTDKADESLGVTASSGPTVSVGPGLG